MEPHGGNVLHYFDQDKKVIDFSANINPLGFPEYVPELIASALKNLIHYPEYDSSSLKKKIGEFHQLKPDKIFVGNGAIEIIHSLFPTLKVKSVLIACPAFSEYEFTAKKNGTRIYYYRLLEKENFRTNLNKIAAIIKKTKIDALWICNPNNPTGHLTSKETLISLLHVCKKQKTTLVVDEAFIDFLPNTSEVSLLDKAAHSPYLIVIRSLTKIYALPGLRVGYAVGHPSVIKKLQAFSHPWNVNLLAQNISEKIIFDSEYIKKTKVYIAREKKYLYSVLRGIERITVFPSSVNFLLIKLHSGKVSDLQETLLKNKILIRNCSNFKFLDNSFFRIAVRKRSENLKLVKALENALT